MKVVYWIGPLLEYQQHNIVDRLHQPLEGFPLNGQTLSSFDDVSV